MVELAGRPLVAWSVAAVSAAETIGAVVIAAPPGREDELRAQVGSGVVVTAGGASRSRSVANALALVETEIVVVHDAARPLAPPTLFDEVVRGLAADDDAQALIAAAPLADTVKRAGGERLEVAETVDRANLWAVQTPQAFKTAALAGALDVPDSELDAATDDAQLLEARGFEVRLHPVAVPNLKVTTQADLAPASALLRDRA